MACLNVGRQARPHTRLWSPSLSGQMMRKHGFLSGRVQWTHHREPCGSDTIEIWNTIRKLLGGWLSLTLQTSSSSKGRVPPVRIAPSHHAGFPHCSISRIHEACLLFSFSQII
jgi:hypothetical protein